MQIDILLHSTSQYQVIRYFEKGLQEAFRKQGVITFEYHIDSDLPLHLAESSADYTFGINIDLPNELARVPHIAYMVDWVTYIPALFSRQQTIVCSVDQQSTELIKKFSSCKAFFLPHAVPEKSIIDTHTIRDRDIDILFAGTFMDEKPLLKQLRAMLSKKFFSAIENIIAESISSIDTSHLHHTLRFLKDYPEYVKELQEKEIGIFDLCNSVERVMRARDRMSLLQAIDREVHIYGNDIKAWKQSLQNKNFIFHEAVNFKDIARLFQRAKIILNSTPMFKEGLHERLLYALANGASVITNQNSFIPLCFSENRSLGTFIAPYYQKVNSVIDKILQNEDKRIKDVKEAQEKIRLQHTWDQRVIKLLENLTLPA